MAHSSHTIISIIDLQIHLVPVFLHYVIFKNQFWYSKNFLNVCIEMLRQSTNTHFNHKIIIIHNLMLENLQHITFTLFLVIFLRLFLIFCQFKDNT